MSNFYISCYNLDTRELDHFKVDSPVYTYIRQLETYVRNPEGSQLKAAHAYAFRFPPEELTNDK